jgi:xanthine phosphoribosyltransferase
VVGVGALIEKSFEGGRDALAQLNVPVESLACIISMESDQFAFASEPPA